MDARDLQLAVWASDGRARLADIEVGVLAAWNPPLNLKDVVTPWRGIAKAARTVLAAEAKRNASG